MATAAATNSVQLSCEEQTLATENTSTTQRKTQKQPQTQKTLLESHK